MADIVDDQFIGPATEQRLRAIKDRVMCCGRKLGIPEDQMELAARLVEIDDIERIPDRIGVPRKRFDWGRAIRNLAASFVGEYDTHTKK